MTIGVGLFYKNQASNLISLIDFLIIESIITHEL